MNCMKCGREVEDSGVFCLTCRGEMERYPVPPGTALVLPDKKSLVSQRRPAAKKKELTPEEQVKRLQTRIKRLSVALTCLCLALALTVAALICGLLRQPPVEDDNIGKNYGTMAPEDVT